MVSSSESPVILVTSATGNLGFEVLKTLLKDDDLKRANYRIRACVFRHSKDVDKVRQLEGIDYMYEVDANVYDSDLSRAFQGVDYVMLVPSSSRNRVKQVQNYVSAAQRNHVSYVVLASMIRPEDVPPNRLGEEFRLMESAVEAMPPEIKFTFVRTPMVLSTLRIFAPDMRKGVLPLPIGDGRFAPLDDGDIGKFAASLFLCPDKHISKAYHLTGPQLVNGEQLASIASGALDRTIRFLNVARDNCKQLMLESGVEDWMAEAYLEFFDDIAKGRYEFQTDLMKFVALSVSEPISHFFVKHRKDFAQPEEEWMQERRTRAVGAGPAPPVGVEQLGAKAKEGLLRGDRRQLAIRQLKSLRDTHDQALHKLEGCCQ